MSHTTARQAPRKPLTRPVFCRPWPWPPAPRLVWCLVLGAGWLAGHSAALAAPAPLPAPLQRPVVTVHALVSVGEMVAQWCDRQSPTNRQAHAEAVRVWKQGFRYDDIQARWPMQMPAPTEARQRDMDANLQQEARKGFDCRSLGAYLARNLNPRQNDPAGWTAIQSALDAPPSTAPGARPDAAEPPTTPPPSVAAAPAGVPAPAAPTGAGRGTDAWGLLPREGAEKVLGKMGATRPLAVGGALRTGAYSCIQVRLYNEAGTVYGSYAYTLSLYPDKGLRVSNVKITRSSSTRPSEGRNFQGTYTYDPANGELSATAWNYDSYDLRDFAMWQGDHKPLQSSPRLITAFRRVVDAQGQDFFYGLQEYADDSQTACRYTGMPSVESPVAEANAAKAQKEAEAFKYRTKANAGLRTEQIEGYLHVVRYSTDAGGAQHAQEHSDLLLKSGWGYRAPAFSPHDFDANASRQFEPLMWLRWRRQGGRIETSDDGANWTVSEGSLRQAVKPAELPGSYQTKEIFGLNPHFAANVVTNTWTFGADGSFSYTSNRSSGGFFNTDTRKGRYKVEGYTLDLVYEDGSTSRGILFGNGARGVVIHGTGYSRL